jgi:hypothetical protein
VAYSVFALNTNCIGIFFQAESMLRGNLVPSCYFMTCVERESKFRSWQMPSKFGGGIRVIIDVFFCMGSVWMD